MYLADFSSSYVSKKAEDLPIEPGEIKNCTVPVSSIDDVKLNPNILVLKNELGEMQKQSTLRYSFSQSVQIEKPRRTLLEAFTVIYALEKSE